MGGGGRGVYIWREVMHNVRGTVRFLHLAGQLPVKVESFLLHDDEMCVAMSFKAMFFCDDGLTSVAWPRSFRMR